MFLIVVHAVFGIAALFAFSLFLGLLHTKQSRLLYGLNGRSWTKAQMVLLGFTTLAVGACLYQGIDALLGWLPSEWGGTDTYGDYTPLSRGIAGSYAVLGTGALMMVLIKHHDQSIELAHDDIKIKGLLKIVDAGAESRALRSISKSFEEDAQSHAEDHVVEMFLSDERQNPDRDRIATLRWLAKIADKQADALEKRNSTAKPFSQIG